MMAPREPWIVSRVASVSSVRGPQYAVDTLPVMIEMKEPVARPARIT